MNFLDLLIIILVIFQIIKWVRTGFLFGVFSLAGLIIGLVIGLLLAPVAVSRLTQTSHQIIAAILTLAICAISIGFLGQYIGKKISHLGAKFRLNMLDKILGGIFGGLASLFMLWIVAASFSGLPYQLINQQISGSLVVRSMEKFMPQAPAVLDKLSRLINPSEFPRFFFGPEPQPLEPVEPPSSAEIADTLRATRGSIIRIESIGCGGILTGSGFVIDDNLVATNAHVVAGSSNHSLQDIDGKKSGEVIFFDENQDVAIIRSRDSLAGGQLELSNSRLERGATATTLGYPSGGPLKASPAAVLKHMNARGRNIYGQNNVTRDIYQLQTSVSEGNSGGPVVTQEGAVVAMIFGRSEAEDNIGYGLTSASLINLLDNLDNNSEKVSTKQCVR